MQVGRTRCRSCAQRYTFAIRGRAHVQ
jgi:hypothetical protein